jgi:hypothetical protein
MQMRHTKHGEQSERNASYLAVCRSPAIVAATQPASSTLGPFVAAVEGPCG